MTVSLFDIRVPAVLLRIDQNPFHHGTLGAVRSFGRAGVEVHVLADSTGSPISRSRYVRQMHPPPPPGSSAHDIALSLRRVAARITRPAVLIPMDDASAVAVNRLRGNLVLADLCTALLCLRAEEAGSCLLLQVFLPPGPERDWFFTGTSTGRAWSAAAEPASSCGRGRATWA